MCTRLFYLSFLDGHLGFQGFFCFCSKECCIECLFASTQTYQSVLYEVVPRDKSPASTVSSVVATEIVGLTGNSQGNGDDDR